MAMTKDQKMTLIDEIESKLKQHPTVYLTNASGLSVAESNDLRTRFRDAGVDFKVYKNTFVRLAMDRIGGYDEVYEHLSGPTAVALSSEPALPAKVIRDFLKGKERKLPEVKGAYIDGAVYGGGTLEALAALKGKNELLGDVIGLLLSPASTVISALQSAGGSIAGIVQTLAEREGAENEG